MCRYSHVESNKVEFSFYDFSMIYNDFAKIQLNFFKKRKRQNCCYCSNGEVSGFIVAGGKPNFQDCWRR